MNALLRNKELLEQAARAAGYKKFRCAAGNFQVGVAAGTTSEIAHWKAWNPLDSNADMLPLQMACYIQVFVNNGYVEATWFNITTSGARKFEEVCEDDSVDARCKAARRAVVRAAAFAWRER